MLHCRNCSQLEACGGFHVYVIELSPAVLENEKFHPDRAGLSSAPRCFYVGQTKHHPACRYKQHRRKRSGKHFVCECFGAAEKVEVTGYNRGNRYVRDYGLKGGLRPEFYLGMNPLQSREESETLERNLATQLIQEGFAVHWN